MIIETAPGGFFGNGMVRGGIHAHDYWASISGIWNETRYGIPNFHRAVDLTNNFQQNYLSPAPATIAHALVDDGDGSPQTRPYGNAVVLQLSIGTLGIAHLHEAPEVGRQLVEDEPFAQGEPWSRSGLTGNTSGPHAHLVASHDATPSQLFTRPDLAVDPIPFLQELCSLPDDVVPPPLFPVILGDLPWAHGTSLVVTTRECAPEEVAAYCASQGVPLTSLGYPDEQGVWLMYIVGAPPPVNANFPPTLPASRALFLRGI